MRSRIVWGWLLIVLSAGVGRPTRAQDREDYDIVIHGGRVVDGSGNPWRRADVGIRGDRIARIGRLDGARAKRTIDATGLVVSPGFIDNHSHSDWLLFEDGFAQSKIRQGVTTDVIGEDSSGGPFKGKLPAREVDVDGRTVTIRTVADYLNALERSGISINVATYVGLGNVWRCVMGESHVRPSSEEFAAMRRLIDEAMADGAFGLSTMLAVPPGLLATTDELVELCRPVAERGGIFSSHIRNEGSLVLDAVDEIIAIAGRAKLTADIIHIKIAEEQLWGRMPEIVSRIEAARRRGIDVQANVYPYTRGNNNLATIAPPWAHDGGRQRFLERLRDPEARARIRADVLEGVEGWYSHYGAVGGDWSRMLVNANLSERNKRFEGWTMDRIIAERNRGRDRPSDPFDVLFDFLVEEGGSISTIYAHHTETDMNLALAQPWCAVGSDGSAYAIEGPLRRGKPHPRNFGTFPRVLGIYVRERGLLRLEEAVRKMTSLCAAKLGIEDRGLLREGFFADITLFNPKSVKDRATYLEPFSYPTGIEYVLVNGEIVLERAVHTGATPGKPLRFDAR